MLRNPHLSKDQDSKLGFFDSPTLCSYGAVCTGSGPAAAVKGSKCLEEAIVRGEPEHVSGLVSCHFPDASHSHLA